MNSKTIILSVVVTAIVAFSGIANAMLDSTSNDTSINSLGMSTNVDWSFLADESDWERRQAPVVSSYSSNVGQSSPTTRSASAPAPTVPEIPSEVIRGVVIEPSELVPTRAVPEPAGLLLLGAGLLGLVFVRRRQLA